MRKLSPALFSSLALVAIACGQAANESSRLFERWNSANEPALMSLGRQDYVIRFDKLPKAAALSKTPWSDTYWPSNRGGISARWNTSTPQDFQYAPPTLAQLKTMSAAQIAQLSPAEKYDILAGDYTFPTVKVERSRTSPSNASWEGICHGWAAVAMLFDEPKTVTLKNADGIPVPFGSSDVKALLSYYQGQIARSQDTRFLASRCNIDINKTPDAANNAECRDVNAGAFHIVLANQISRDEGFIADVTRDLQVWNQPIYSFKSVVLGEQGPSSGAARGTVKEAIVKTQMTYTMETQPAFAPFGNAQALRTKEYQYRLELNAMGEIIGGEWISQDRPDFLWNQGRPTFTGYFSKIQEIYNASVQAVVTPAPTPQPTATPTAAPTVAPTAVPTAAPTVAPTATPTVIPTVAPTATPTPVVTAQPLPLPTRTPVPDSQNQPHCPAGFTPTALPGAQGVFFCSNGTKVLGPVTEKMIDTCLFAFHQDCYEPNWNVATYLKFRGTDRCMPGTTFDVQTGYCTQNDRTRTVSAFGPFTKELVERCVKASGGEACNTLRWNRDFLIKLQLR